MNVATGYTQAVGHMSAVMYDLAYSPGGKLYGVDSHSNLYTISTSTAAIKEVGSTGASLNGLTFSASGVLYASGGDEIYTLSTSTGKATKLESVGSNSSAGDLAFDKSGNLYLTTTGNNLVRINVSAHSYKVVGAIGYSQVLGLAFANNTLYGLSNSSDQVISINVSTGKGTLVASFRSGSQSGAYGAAFGTAAAPVAPVRPTIYASDNNGDLYTVNLGTGKSHLIGDMGVTLFDLAEDTHGNLYGVDSKSDLYRINSTTAKLTYIGYTGVFLNALTFSSGGTLYAAGNNGLYTLSTTTGHATEIGTIGSDISSGDLAFDKSGNLYWTDTADHLIKINLTARTFKDLGAIGFDEVYGLIYGSDGVLYGLSNTSDQIFSLNVTTGKGTLVSSFAGQMHGVNGAAAVPA
jgi:hypothetical protein